MIILIADSHVRSHTARADEFRAMLQTIANSEHDLIFLGDILDLWIALPRYESPYCAEFLHWCRQEKERRRIIFIEGNHEFHVARRHHQAFSDSAVLDFRLGSCLFLHGDLIQCNLVGHRILHNIAKSRLGELIFRYAPWGPAITNWAKKRLSSKSRGIASFIPEKTILDWTACTLKEDCRHVFMGHFHLGKSWELPEGRSCNIVPAWKYSGEIGLLDKENASFQTGNWRELLGVPGESPQAIQR
jgi:UDP-2,3-diacylglucosamine hydrolase